MLINGQGVPFRETHHISGAAVKMSEDRGVPLDSLTPADLRTLHSAFEDDVQEVWDYETRCHFFFFYIIVLRSKYLALLQGRIVLWAKQ